MLLQDASSSFSLKPVLSALAEVTRCVCGEYKICSLVYKKVDGKVRWSPIIPYTFTVPQEWEEVLVSIVDLGGTEIDLRFASLKEGRLSVIVVPVKRFSDGLSEDVNIEQIGPPEKVINAFGLEVIGERVEEKVLSAQVAEHSGRKYYGFKLEPPHVLIAGTAAGNRLYLFSVTRNGAVFITELLLR